MSKINNTKKTLSREQRSTLLSALKARFEKNIDRHKGLDWAKVQAKLEATAEKLWSLHEMERTGGEPEIAAAMDIELLTEEQYRDLQKLGNFDTKTSSWVKTPAEIRKSYYAARGFRGSLRV